MMNKVLVSFAHGYTHPELLKVALPTFYKYSVKHSYDIFIPSYNHVIDVCNRYGWKDYNRPISWLKVPLIRSLLEKYETVLWLDSDVVIVKNDIDIASNFNNDYIQSFVVHNTNEGYIPNMGIWLLNQNADNLLNNIWHQTDCINHGWWEQKANMNLMNWNQSKETQDNLTMFGSKSLQLPYEWNVHKHDKRFDPTIGRFLHATTWPNMLDTMKEWSCQSL